MYGFLPVFQVGFLNAEVDRTPYINHSSMTVCHAIPPEGLKVFHIQQWFPPLVCTHWGFPRVPESYSTAQGGERPKFFVIVHLEILFFNW